MSQLILTRGIPASGKTTYAKVWVTNAPNRVRVNRDDIRFQLYGVYFGPPIDEDVVTRVQRAMINAALSLGNDVIVDDTNLNDKFLKRLVGVGHRAQAEVKIMDFEIDLKEALRRNAARERQVPEDVIRKFHDKFSNRKEIDLTPPTLNKYEGTPGKPKAYGFDIDGTIAKMSGRSPYEWHRVGEDSPVDHVISTAQALSSAGYKILVMSGRDGSCYDITQSWMDSNGMPYDEFVMRAAGDMRPDNVVKAELFDTHIRDNFDVKAIYDDRDQVVEAWRSMGIPCYQVAAGDF